MALETSHQPPKIHVPDASMTSPQQIRSTVTTYIDMMCRNDINGIMTPYADDATDTFCFNEEGNITSMRAHWNPAEIRAERYAS